MRSIRVNSTSGRRAAVAAGLVLAAAALGGCETAGQGAVSGGAVGALSGLAIGSLSGNAGQGAAIGAVVGVVGGAIIGDQNRRRNEEALKASPPPAPSTYESAGPRYEAAGALERLVGRWDVQGWVQPVGGERTSVSGSATGVADKKFFVRVELRLDHPLGGEAVEGTSVISQNGGRKITMVNSFSTSPEVKRLEGELDESGSIFTLRQVSPRADRRIVIRQSGSASWVAECWERAPGAGGVEQRVESLTFTAAR